MNTTVNLPTWTARLASAIAMSVAAIAPRVERVTVIRFAVDCHPWNGTVGLAMLTAEELAADPKLANSAEMAAWKYYDFAQELESQKLILELGKAMRSAYEQSKNRPATTEVFFKACAAAVASTEVAEALKMLNRDSAFRLSVPHPDTDQEFVVS